MNVVRAVLATGGSVFGDTAFTNPASGATYTKIYTYTIDTTKYVPKSMKVIGMVQKPGPASTSAGNIIENSIQAKVRLMPGSLSASGENEVVKSMTEVALFPNPAKNRITVRGVLAEPSATTIDIYNSTGQLIISKDYPAGGSNFGEVIDLSAVANGEYFMNITNAGERVTKSFVINR
jgi:Secretion system C-terminal sorting domain